MIILLILETSSATAEVIEGEREIFSLFQAKAVIFV